MSIYESQSQRQRAAGVFGRVAGLTDRFVSPDTRQQLYSSVINFSNEQPLLAVCRSTFSKPLGKDKANCETHQAFLFIQLLLSFTPIALFASFVLATVLFSFITAFLFSLFWIGAAVLVLVPTLFVTVSIGIAVWAWAVGSFILSRWLYNLIPLTVRGGMAVDMPNGKTVLVSKTGDGYGDVDAKVETTG